MEYLVLFRCELAPKERDFVDHFEFANSLEEAQKKGIDFVNDMHEYPMNAGYSVYKIIQV